MRCMAPLSGKFASDWVCDEQRRSDLAGWRADFTCCPRSGAAGMAKWCELGSSEDVLTSMCRLKPAPRSSQKSRRPNATNPVHQQLSVVRVPCTLICTLMTRCHALWKGNSPQQGITVGAQSQSTFCGSIGMPLLERIASVFCPRTAVRGLDSSGRLICPVPRPQYFPRHRAGL